MSRPIVKRQVSRLRSVDTTFRKARMPSAAQRAAGHLATPDAERGEAWIDEAWSIASDLRAAGQARTAERLEDACERLELIADGKNPPRKRRSDAPRRGPPGFIARTVANGLRDGCTVEQACRYAGVTPAAHAAWMLSPSYRAEFGA